MSHAHFGGTRRWSVCSKPWGKTHMHQLQCVWSYSDIGNGACCEVESNTCLSHCHQVQMWGLICLYRTHTHQWAEVTAIQCPVRYNFMAYTQKLLMCNLTLSNLTLNS
jgi:hypothetical protein